jgi:hypothetical protein
MRSTLISSIVAVALLLVSAGPAAARPGSPSDRIDAATMRGLALQQRQLAASAGKPAPVEIVRVTRVADGGFDWSDAGIGAGLAAAVLLSAAGASTLRRQHSPATR